MAPVHHGGHQQVDPSALASPVPQRASDVLYSSSLVNHSGKGLSSMQDRSMGSVSMNQPRGQIMQQLSAKQLVELFHKVRLNRDHIVELIQALMQRGWSNRLHHRLELFLQEISPASNPATHHAPSTRGHSVIASIPETLLNQSDHGADHQVKSLYFLLATTSPAFKYLLWMGPSILK